LCKWYEEKNVNLRARAAFRKVALTDADIAQLEEEYERHLAARTARLQAVERAACKGAIIAINEEEEDIDINSPEDEEGEAMQLEKQFMGDYNDMLKARKSENLTERYWSLHQKYTSKKQLLAYLDKAFWPFREQLADCYVNRHYNFNYRVSSNGEGAHSELKSYLNNSLGNLLVVSDAIDRWISNKEKNYNLSLGLDHTCRQPSHKISLLAKVTG
jgi:hypothetical protein